MIQSTRAITLALISAGSILAGYHAFNQIGQNYDELASQQNDWGNATTRPAGHSHYYGHYGGSGWAGSSRGRAGSFGMHGTSYGGYGGTGHAGGS